MSHTLRSLLTRAARHAATGLRLGVVGLLGVLLLTQGQSSALSGHPHPAHWREVTSPADLDQAFAQAQRDAKPVFLYWEPANCDPCQHPQARLFTREDFVLLSRRFIAVHVDGDAPGLQRLAAQLRLRDSSPSTLLFSPTRDELTRLSGDLDAAQFLGALRSAIGGSATRQAARPLRQVVDDALTGLELPNYEWRQLANYAWDEAPAPLAEPRERARVLAQLAQACPLQLRASRARLLIQAVAAVDRVGRPIGAVESVPWNAAERHDRADRLPEALRRSTALALRRVFDDERSSRELLDLITLRTPVVLASLTEPASTDGIQLRSAWDRALQRLADDPSLTTDQRVSALQARLDLALLGRPRASAELPASLRDEIRRAAVQFVDAAHSGADRTAARHG
ncbi:MAG TPA: thioredoxin family protein, partial [Burkholderiaceae bacterium]|nr:thioredoxin family protein [Burkholderiaceae bacterium]